MATTPPGRAGALIKGAGLLTAGVLAGGLLGGVLSASAATTTTPTPTPAATAGADGSATVPDGHGPGGPGGRGDGAEMRGPDPVRSDEQSVSDDVAATLTAAAEDAVPGGTVYRVETDAGDAAYEVHMTDADGNEVTVKFDENLSVVEVQDGMGTGDPALQSSDSGSSTSGSSSSSSSSSA